MNWEKLAWIFFGWMILYGFSKQLQGIHQTLIEIRQALWDIRQQNR